MTETEWQGWADDIWIDIVDACFVMEEKEKHVEYRVEGKTRGGGGY